MTFLVFGPVENWGDPWVLLMPAAAFVYFAMVWLAVGRDPKPGTSVTQYHPPEGLSPAAVRYIYTGGSDHKTLASVLASLAVKRMIAIQPQEDGFRVQRLAAPAEATLAPEEESVLNLLFVPTGNRKDLSDPAAQSTDPRVNPDVAYIRPENNQRNSGLVMAIQGSLGGRLSGVYFRNNAGWTLLGVAGSILGALAVANETPSREGLMFMTLWFLMFTLMFGMIFVVNVVPAIRDALAGRMGTRNTLQTTLPLAVFLAIPGFVAYKIGQQSNWVFSLMLVSLVVVNVAWGSVMPSLTPRGRKVLDEILGYRQFLEEVELHRMDALNRPGVTPQLLDESLAYAIALDAKEAWGDHLCDTVFGATRAR